MDFTERSGGMKLLYRYNVAKLVHFLIPDKWSTSAPCTGTLGEVPLGSGCITLMQAQATQVVYLKIATIRYPILRTLRVWRIGQRFICPVPSGGYWRLELISQDNEAADRLAALLEQLVRFQRDPLPFDRQLLMIDKTANKLLGSIGRTRSVDRVVPTPKRVHFDIPGDASLSDNADVELPIELRRIERHTRLWSSSNPEAYLDKSISTSGLEESVPVIRFTPNDLNRLLQYDQSSPPAATTSTIMTSPDNSFAQELDEDNVQCKARVIPHHLVALFSSNAAVSEDSSMRPISDTLYSWDESIDSASKLNNSAADQVVDQAAHEPDTTLTITTQSALKSPPLQNIKTPLDHLFPNDRDSITPISDKQLPQLHKMVKSMHIPSMSTTSIDEDEWDILVDELDTKNQLLNEQLETLYRHSHPRKQDGKIKSIRGNWIGSVEVCQMVIGGCTLYSLIMIALSVTESAV